MAKSLSASQPLLTEPTFVPFEKATRLLWGDKTTGQVADWVYAASDKIYQIVYGLPSGGAFRHSEQVRTVFAADVLYYVLEGVLVMNNPETGEVHRADPGEAVFFRKDTWQHGFSLGAEPLRVLEYLCPPPSRGTTQAYAHTKPNLTRVLYGQDQWLGRWPAAQEEARSRFTMRVIRPADLLWRLEGESTQVLVGILVSTEHVTVAKLRLLPGQGTEPRRHGGDLSLYLLEGALQVRLPDRQGPAVYELKPRDGFFVPEGTSYQLTSLSGGPVELVFGVAPHYRLPSGVA